MKNQPNNFYKDLIIAQSEIQTLYKDEKNPFFKSKYVPLANILREVKPVLNRNNFLLVQQTCIENGNDIIKTKIIHESGDSIESTAPLKMDEREKNNPQKYGSAVTYMRRYTLTSLLALEEEDDDGNAAANNKTDRERLAAISNKDMQETQRKYNEQQFKNLKDKLESCGSVEELAGAWEDNQKIIRTLNKYAPDLYSILLEAKEKMKEILDPEEEGEND